MAEGLFDAYLAGAAGDFYPGHFADAAARCAAVRAAARPLAPAVAAALEAQNARLAPSPARDAHLAALRRGAAAVVTGQQVGLFLGPLFTIYKAASAVAVARALSEESGTTVVPVFWLQTEDHDLPEIATCHLAQFSEAPIALRLPAAPDERISIAHRTLPHEVTERLAQVGDALRWLPDAETHVARLARHYRPGVGWAEAFAGLLGDLFAPTGLVLIDPRTPELAAASAPVHRRALVDAEPLAAALAARVAALAAAGYPAPVHVRPGSPLSFFHDDGPAGPRHRLVPAPGGFTEVGRDRTHARETLLARLDAEPQCFSTSALLRPILQDTLLPTAAYVGGPAEVAYFAQLSPLYDAYALRMPLIVPRASFRLVDELTAFHLEKTFGVSTAAAEGSEAALLAALDATSATQQTWSEVMASRLSEGFELALRNAEPAFTRASPAERVAFEKTARSVRRAVAKMTAKTQGQRLYHEKQRIEHARLIQHRLFPNGVAQERICGLSYYAARFGEAAVIDRVLSAVAPFDPTRRDIVLTDYDSMTSPPPGGPA